MEVGPGLVGVAVVGPSRTQDSMWSARRSRAAASRAARTAQLDEDVRAVAPFLHHAADSGEMALSASEAAHDRVDVLVLSHAPGL